MIVKSAFAEPACFFLKNHEVGCVLSLQRIGEQQISVIVPDEINISGFCVLRQGILGEKSTFAAQAVHAAQLVCACRVTDQCAAEQHNALAKGIPVVHGPLFLRVDVHAVELRATDCAVFVDFHVPDKDKLIRCAPNGISLVAVQGENRGRFPGFQVDSHQSAVTSLVSISILPGIQAFAIGQIGAEKLLVCLKRNHSAAVVAVRVRCLNPGEHGGSVLVSP